MRILQDTARIFTEKSRIFTEEAPWFNPDARKGLLHTRTVSCASAAPTQTFFCLPIFMLCDVRAISTTNPDEQQSGSGTDVPLQKKRRFSEVVCTPLMVLVDEQRGGVQVR